MNFLRLKEGSVNLRAVDFIYHGTEQSADDIRQILVIQKRNGEVETFHIYAEDIAELEEKQILSDFIIAEIKAKAVA